MAVFFGVILQYDDVGRMNLNWKGDSNFFIGASWVQDQQADQYEDSRYKPPHRGVPLLEITGANIIHDPTSAGGAALGPA